MQDSPVPTPPPSPERLILVSPCGHGNLGDAAIQDATVAALREVFPDAEIIGATLNPADTRERHGIDAVPIAGLSQPQYLVYADAPTDTRTSASVADATPIVPQQTRRPARWLTACAALARALLPRGLPYRLRTDFQHTRLAWRTLAGVRWLIISGGGQLDDFWGGAWSHPYALAKWALLARLRGGKVAFLSVGFGTLEQPCSKPLARCALHLARYRSYRDAGSASLLRQAGFRDAGLVVPDLAYGWPLTPPGPKGVAGDGGRPLVITLSPMVWCDPKTWPVADAAHYERYKAQLAAIAQWLLARGHRLRLVASDGPDNRAVAEVDALIRAAVARDPGAALQILPTHTVTDFVAAAGQADVAIASRLHGVLLSHLAHTPVIAISYERKVAGLMADMGQQELCLDITRFELADFVHCFEQLEDQLDTRRREVAAYVADCRQQVDRQYRQLAEL